MQRDICHIWWRKTCSEISDALFPGETFRFPALVIYRHSAAGGLSVSIDGPPAAYSCMHRQALGTRRHQALDSIRSDGQAFADDHVTRPDLVEEDMQRDI